MRCRCDIIMKLHKLPRRLSDFSGTVDGDTGRFPTTSLACWRNFDSIKISLFFYAIQQIQPHWMVPVIGYANFCSQGSTHSPLLFTFLLF